MNCTQNLGHKIGGAVFLSKLTREEKIEIFERRKMGETIASLAKAFNIHESNIKYLIALIEKYGNNILKGYLALSSAITLTFSSLLAPFLELELSIFLSIHSQL